MSKILSQHKCSAVTGDAKVDDRAWSVGLEFLCDSVEICDGIEMINELKKEIELEYPGSDFSMDEEYDCLQLACINESDPRWGRCEVQREWQKNFI